MKITMKDKKGCGGILSDDTFFYHIWLNGLNTLEVFGAYIVVCFRPVETSHKYFSYLFCKIGD